jgi:uncharacterized membrane protein YidH (DUF202 family)
MEQNKFSWKRVLFGLKEERTEEDKKAVQKILLTIIIIAFSIIIISYANFLSHDWARERLWNGIKENYRKPWFIVVVLAFLARLFGLSLTRFVRPQTNAENTEVIQPEKPKIITSLPKDGKLQGVESFKSFLWFLLIFTIGMILLLAFIFISSIIK